MASGARRSPPQRGAIGLFAITAVVALAVGVLVYVLDRPAATVYLLPEFLSLATGDRSWFGAFGGYLPGFLHVYAFILLTVAVSPWPARVVPVCALWWAVDSLFELGQHPAFAPHITGALPAWFQQVPILDNTGSYFLHGTFDSGDLVAIALGTLFAYLTVAVVYRSGVPHARDA